MRKTFSYPSVIPAPVGRAAARRSVTRHRASRSSGGWPLGQLVPTQPVGAVGTAQGAVAESCTSPLSSLRGGVPDSAEAISERRLPRRPCGPPRNDGCATDPQAGIQYVDSRSPASSEAGENDIDPRLKHSGMTKVLLGTLIACFFVVVAESLVLAAPVIDNDTEAVLTRIPVQSGGRVKPFESFAREIALFLTGKQRFEHRNPTALVWEWMTQPDVWHEKAFLFASPNLVATDFPYAAQPNRVAPHDVLAQPLFLDAAKAASAKQEAQEALSPLEKQRLKLFERARLFQAIAEGRIPAFIPHPDNARHGWLPLQALATEELVHFYDTEVVGNVHHQLGHLVHALRGEETESVLERAQAFALALTRLRGSRDIALDERALGLEFTYNRVKPFRWAWALYLAGGILLLVKGRRRSASPPPALALRARTGTAASPPALALRARTGTAASCPRPEGGAPAAVVGRVQWLGLIPLMSGLALHTYGFILRSLVAGRPPVTNMYESIIWVSWAIVVFAFILWCVYRNKVLVATAAMAGALTLLVGEGLPAVLDPAIEPLVPVLRSNFWLTIHVLTITLSYGALALAWALSHVVLFQLAFFPRKKEWYTQSSEYVYRAMQIGVILLAAGTILGGVWANYSWGRFWGWDPKETWALIALLAYLTVLHGRFAGWLKHFGVAMWSALAFLTVVMAWYGVNFVLAAGLHSYGFGGGGLPAVLAVVGVDLATLTFLGVKAKGVSS